MTTPLTTVAVPTWPRPSGYSNGVITEGRLLHIAGQIGWDAEASRVVLALDDTTGKPFVSKGSHLLIQLRQALKNVVAIVRAAGAEPTAIARMTIYVTELDAYRSQLKDFGAIWRAELGKHFPAMALIGVAGLVEPDAVIEIEAVAVLRDASQPKEGTSP